MLCDQLRADLPRHVERSAPLLPKALRGHVSTCVSCQRELASYRRLGRELRTLRSSPTARPPEGLVDLILGTLDEAEPERRQPLTAGHLGGLAVAATAAGAAGAWVLVGRGLRARATQPS